MVERRRENVKNPSQGNTRAKMVVTITEIKDTLEIIKSQLNKTEAHRESKDRVVVITTVEQ